MHYDRAMMAKRRAPLIISFLFLLSSLALLNQANRYFNPPEPVIVAQPCTAPMIETVAVPAQTQGLQVDGIWEQYAIEDGQRRFMARLEVRTDGADYMASPLELAEGCGPPHAYRSYDHAVSGDVWTFREDWDGGEVGVFALLRQPNGEYVGTATHANCGISFDTVYVRVGDLDQ